MALIWAKTTSDTHFEVRRAGRSVRLYTNGVFHSQFNPVNPITDTVWNLLLLPAFFRPVEKTRHVLVLGVGGGAVIQLLHRFVQPERILGVELDPTHIHIARRFFGISSEVANLVEADAADWLRRYRGPKFDLIIDDLFGEKDGEPIRAVKADEVWLKRLSGNLASDGVLVMNFISVRTLREAGRTLQRTVPSRLSSSFCLSLPGYENAVGAFTTEARDARQLRRLLKATGAKGGIRLSRLPYRIRRLSI